MLSATIRLIPSLLSSSATKPEESASKQTAESPGDEPGAESQHNAADSALAKSADAEVTAEHDGAVSNSESAENAGAKDDRAEDSDTTESDQKLFQAKKRRRSVEKDMSPAPSSSLERPATADKPKAETNKATARSPRPKKQKGTRKEDKTQGASSAASQDESSKDKPQSSDQHKSNEKSNSSCSDAEAQDKDGVALDGLKVPPLKIVLPQLSGEKEVLNDVPAVPVTKGKQLPYIVNSPLAGEHLLLFLFLDRKSRTNEVPLTVHEERGIGTS